MKKHQVLLLLFSILNVATLKAKVEIASIFNDNMVLQQQMDVNIWGTASPNKKVTIQPTWTSTVFSTTSDKNGKWKTKISTPEAGGPYHIKISDGLYERVRSFEPLDYKSADRTALIDFMMNAGIIGLGGAGFPAYIKYKFAKDVKKLIINAVECEPFITADYKMIQAHKEEFVTGVAAMKKMAMAPEAVIAIKKTHPDLIQFVEEAVKGMEGFSVAAVPDVYPMGWERVLVREIMHAEYEKLPGEVGAIVNNATTAIAFGDALLTGTPIVSKTLTVSGNAIKKPVNVQVPVGVPVSEIVAACGGYTCEDVRLIAGGPMMGKTIVNDKFVIDRNMNALTILENKPFDSIACLRCGKCSDHCPAGLQPVRIAQAVKTNDKKAMEKLCAMDCIECGLCTYICPSRLDVTENVRRAKRQLMLAKK